jgi:hypothetical protein
MRTFIIIAFLVFSTLCPLVSQEYSVFGDASLETSLDLPPREGSSADLSAGLFLTANHRLIFEDAEAVAYHELTARPDGRIAHRLYEAYLLLPLSDWLELQAGRQRVQWGTGTVFVPSDALNPPENQGGKKHGFDGAAVYIEPVPDFSLTAAVNLSSALTAGNPHFWEDIRYGAETSLLLGTAEMRLSGVYQWEEILRPALGVSIDLAGFIINGEAVLEFYNTNIYPYESAGAPYGIAFSTPDAGSPHFLGAAEISKHIASGDLSFFIAAGYRYSDLGYSRAEEDLLFELASYYGSLTGLGPAQTQLPRYLGTHYLALSFSADLYLSFSTAHSVLINISDGSAVFDHELRLLTIPSIDLLVTGRWTLGGRLETEFGSSPERLKLSAAMVMHF